MVGLRRIAITVYGELCNRERFLRTFAFHYQTGEPLPDELIERIMKSRNFMAAYGCLRQVSFGLLDMAYYTQEKEFTADIMPYEREAWKRR